MRESKVTALYGSNRWWSCLCFSTCSWLLSLSLLHSFPEVGTCLYLLVSSEQVPQLPFQPLMSKKGLKRRQLAPPEEPASAAAWLASLGRAGEIMQKHIAAVYCMSVLCTLLDGDTKACCIGSEGHNGLESRINMASRASQMTTSSF